MGECHMLPRAAFFKGSKALILLPVLAALPLAGCDEMAAQTVPPVRPVLVATVHYEPQAPDRSFVGTVRPRIESDLGFRVTGKVAKRLVEVGARVTTGEPLATLDETDLRLQVEQAEAEDRAATGVLEQARAAEARTSEIGRASCRERV